MNSSLRGKQKKFVSINHLFYKKSKRKVEIPVTVCIAAKCGDGVIIGAADRMKTAGDVQFEPGGKKIFGLTSSILALTAGDSAIQAEILKNVLLEVMARIKKNPKTWLLIKEVAENYRHYYNNAKNSRAENDILVPLGLTFESFTSQQKEMDPRAVEVINSNLMNYKIPPVEVILAGVDDEGGQPGAQIYTVQNGEIRCWNTVGFASIGIGARHALSQFMYAKHDPFAPLADTLLLVYQAKRRAEVAPGVGEATDMFMVGPELGNSTSVLPNVQEKLEKTYLGLIEKEKEFHSNCRIEFDSFVEEIKKSAVEKPQEQSKDKPSK